MGDNHWRSVEMVLESKASSKTKRINFDLEKFKQRALSPNVNVKRELAIYTKNANISKKRISSAMSFRESPIKS